MTSDSYRQIAAAISEATGLDFRPGAARPVGGGCINSAVHLVDGERGYFVKTNDPGSVAMFEAERDGLRDMAIPGAPRVPRPVAAGTADGFAYLALEYIELGRLSGSAWSRLGEQLVVLHRQTAREFGWHRDNTIGATPQVNHWTPHWVDFWCKHRLGYQLDLAESRGLSRDAAERGRRLQERLKDLFPGYDPPPSLLHGDLWGGNVAADESGEPVIFDPAVYHGDREADIAMTELFGRFDRRFYDAYQGAWALDPGYAQRRTLYNLYHVLNHFNLFGGGYGSQAAAMIDELLAAVR